MPKRRPAAQQKAADDEAWKQARAHFWQVLERLKQEEQERSEAWEQREQERRQISTGDTYTLPCHLEGDTVVIDLPQEQWLAEVQRQKRVNEDIDRELAEDSAERTTHPLDYMDLLREAWEAEHPTEQEIAALQSRLEHAQNEAEYLQVLERWMKIQPIPQPAPAPAKRRARQSDLSQVHQKSWLTIGEAAALLNMSRAKLYDKWLTGENFHPWVKNGLWSFTIGGQRVIARADVDTFAQRMRGQQWRDVSETKAPLFTEKKRGDGKPA